MIFCVVVNILIFMKIFDQLIVISVWEFKEIDDYQ